MDIIEQRSIYRQINRNYPIPFVYHVGGEAGFFSEYNNMILGMLYCLDKGINFSIYSRDANFKFDKGWTDYFLPFCEERGNWFHSIFNVRHIPTYKRRIYTYLYHYGLYLFKHIHPDLLTTSDLWKYIHYQDINTQYDFPSLKIKGDLRSVCRQLILMTWIYNEATKDAVESYKQRITLPDKYVGLHIRGGDKFEEIQTSNVDLYIKKAEQYSDLRYAFVSTDDYSVFETLVRQYPQWTFSTLCETNERGYYHTQFVHEGVDAKRYHYYQFFASMDILSESEFFVGTFSSNIGMYLGMKMPRGKAVSVDIPEWKIW